LYKCWDNKIDGDLNIDQMPELLVIGVDDESSQLPEAKFKIHLFGQTTKHICVEPTVENKTGVYCGRRSRAISEVSSEEFYVVIGKLRKFVDRTARTWFVGVTGFFETEIDDARNMACESCLKKLKNHTGKILESASFGTTREDRLIARDYFLEMQATS